MRFEDRGKNTRAMLTADMQRYVGTDCRPWRGTFFRRILRSAYEHPGIWAVIIFRYGQWIEFRCHTLVVRQILNLHYYFLFNWVRSRWQIEIPRTTTIDAGLRIDHFGAIIVNSQIVAGKNLTIGHGVLLGQTDTGIPRLGDNISIGVGAKVIGGITVGDNALIGCAAVVTKDVPPNAVVAGVPAKVLRYRLPVGSEAVQEAEERAS